MPRWDLRNSPDEIARRDEIIARQGPRDRRPQGDPEKSLHLISTWTDGCCLTPGQLLVDGKTNEITAIPKLLRELDAKGATGHPRCPGLPEKDCAGNPLRRSLLPVRPIKANYKTLHGEVAVLAHPEALNFGKAKDQQLRHHDPGPVKFLRPHRTPRRQVVDYLGSSPPTAWIPLIGESSSLPEISLDKTP